MAQDHHREPGKTQADDERKERQREEKDQRQVERGAGPPARTTGRRLGKPHGHEQQRHQIEKGGREAQVERHCGKRQEHDDGHHAIQPPLRIARQRGSAEHPQERRKAQRRINQRYRCAPEQTQQYTTEDDENYGGGRSDNGRFHVS